MISLKPLGILLAAVVVSCTAAQAADLPSMPASAPATVSEVPLGFYAHVGPAGLIMDEGATLKVAGQKLTGATIAIKSQVTAAIEFGYFVTPNVAVSFTGGVPPLAKIEADGTLKGYPTIGKVSYGPMTLTAHYHFLDLGRFQPYLGAGPAFMYVFDDNDGMMSHLKVKEAVGVAFQAGADIMLDQHWGMFIDVKKAVLRTHATGFLGAAPVKASVTLDPLVLSGGVSYRF
jgi:outer membrane protein